MDVKKFKLGAMLSVLCLFSTVSLPAAGGYHEPIAAEGSQGCVTEADVVQATFSLHEPTVDENASGILKADVVLTPKKSCAQQLSTLDSGTSNPDITLPNTVWNTDIESKVGSLENDLQGERIEKSSGALSFRHVDVSLPGNSHLPVEFTRTYQVDGIDYSGNILGGWTPDVPFITMRLDEELGWVADGGLGSASHCFANALPRISGAVHGVNDHSKLWGHLRMSIPGQGMKTLVRPSRFSVNHPYDDPNVTSFNQVTTGTTTDNWKVTCAGAIQNAPGQAMVAVSPNGDTYYFDVFVKRYAGFETYLSGSGGRGSTNELRWIQAFHYILYASKVVDASGNYVEYTYDESGYLTRIASNDGRVIDIDYDPPPGFPIVSTDPFSIDWEGTYKRIKRVTANGRSWEYSYAASTDGNYYTEALLNLRYVTLPDGKKWVFNLPLQNNRATEFFNSYRCWAADRFNADGYMGSWLKRLPAENYIIHPQGTRVDYDFALIKNAGGQKNRSGAQPSGVDEVFNFHGGYDNFGSICDSKFSNMVVVKALTEKTITKTDGEQFYWEFSYDQSNHCRAPSVSDKPTKQRTEIGPDGTRIERHYYCDNAEHNQLAREEVYENNSLLQVSTYSYDVETYTIPFGYTFLGFDFEQNNALLKERVVSRGSDQFNKRYTYDINQASHDYSFGMPLSIRESSNVQSGERDFIYEYQHDVDSWILRRLTKVTQNGKELDQVVYDTAGRPTEHYRLGRLAGTYSYHTSPASQLGTLKQFTDALNRKTLFANFKRGIPQKITRADGKVLRMDVDSNGWIKKTTDASGHCTNYQYDDVGRLTFIEPCDSRWLPTTISYRTTSSSEGLSYVTAGMLKQTITKGDYERILYHDSMLRPILEKEWDKSLSSTQRFKRFQYDGYGRPTFSSLPHESSHTPQGVFTEYDGLGRVKSVNNNTLSGHVSYAYLSDNRVQVTDNLGNVATTQYLDYGFPSQQVPKVIDEPEDVLTSMVYDIHGNLRAISQGGITEHRVYDAYFQLCKTVRPDVGNTAFTYNNAGMMIWQASGNSVSSNSSTCDDSVSASDKQSFSYDDLDNLKVVTYGDGTPSKIYSYDANNNLKQLQAGSAIWDYQYNSASLLEEEILTVDNLSWMLASEYNSQGHLSTQVYPSGKHVNYAPNALGQPRRVGDYATAASYHPSGQLKSFTYGNGLQFSQSLDTSLRPFERRVNQSGTAVLRHRHYYDSNHNLERLQDVLTASKTIELGYDGLDRLISASGFWGNGSFTYDALGNIRSQTLGSQSLTYTYNTNNRLTGISGSVSRSFGYDTRGNITSNGQRSFNFNLANQLISSGTNSYQYDGHGRRVLKNKNGEKTYSMYNSQGMLMTTYENNGYTDYYYLGAQLVARYSDPNTQSDKPGYTGHIEDDDLQLTYMQQRYYDPMIGRFYSNDPVGFTPSNPMMFNRYAYANNNPYRFVDPDGKFPRNANDMARYRSMGQMQQAELQIRLAQSHANEVMAPNDLAGVVLGGVGVVASGVAASTVVGTGPGAVGLFLSLDGIRSSWTGSRTLSGMVLESGATSLGLEREDIARAGKLGDLVQGASSGGAKSLHNAARSIGSVGDGAQATLLLRDTANMAGGVQVYSVNGRIDSAKLDESVDKKE